MADTMDYEKFHPDKWSKLSLNQRLESLQTLENHHASRAGRQPYTITANDFESKNKLGRLDAENKHIQLNKSHLKTAPMVCFSVHTTLHEGRHAYQKEAITDSHLHHNKDQVALWRTNEAFYIQGRVHFAAYKFQPVERDADQYADREFNKIYQKLEREHGPIKLYGHAKMYLDREHIDSVEEAIKDFGPNYEQEIDKAIQRNYQRQYGIGKGQVYREFGGGQKQNVNIGQSSDSSMEHKAYRISVKLRENARPIESYVMVKPQVNKDAERQYLQRSAADFAGAQARRAGLRPGQTKDVSVKVKRVSHETYRENVQQKTMQKSRGIER